MTQEVRVYGIDPESIVDGPGIRYALFVQGCTHHCPGCHNPESQVLDAGTMYDVEAIFADVKAHRIVRDVTFSGGEPFEQPEALVALARLLKEAGYGLWVWSGYTYEQLLARDEATPEGAATHELLQLADVLVDGPFVQARRTLSLQWRGSANQRVIDLAKTRAARAAADATGDEVVLWQSANPLTEDFLRRPQSW